MTKKIISLLLTFCMVIGLMPCIALAAETRTVTVVAGAGGQVSVDGASWSDSVTATIPVGEKIGDRIQYRVDEGYALDSITSLVNIVAVAVGDSHTVILDDEGRVYTCGDNYYGQRGVGSTTSPYPTGSNQKWQFLRVTNGIDENTRITAIAAGNKYTVLLDEDGNVYTAGYNNKGQLGRSISSASKIKTYGDICFAKVTVGYGNVKIKAIAAGQSHVVLVDENGKVWTAGSNSDYQLGRKRENNAKYDETFRQVTGDVNNAFIIAAAAGTTHTLLLDNEGNVWATGSNSSGESGFKYSNIQTLKEFTKCSIPGSPKIAAISAGSDHSVLLDENGSVYTAGNNLGQTKGNAGIDTCGQLGNDQKLYGTNSFSKVTGAVESKKIVSVSAGSKYTVAVGEDGAVYATGLNSTGQLGMSAETWNQPGFTQISEGIGNTKIVSAEAGALHTILLDGAGKIWSAGSNSDRALGQNITDKNCTTFAPALDSPELQGKIDPNTFTVTGDCTVNISFKAKTKVNVYYNCAGGSWVSGFTPESYFYKEDNIFAPPALDKIIKNGYTPVGWSKTAYGNSETYTMKWEPKSGYSVIFDTNGGSALSGKTNVKWTDKVLDGITIPTKIGYDFIGWKFGNIEVTADTTYAGLAVNDTLTTVTLTAQWRDVAVPTGEIKIAENVWNSFLKDITFGLFFREAQTVTITATDNSGETVRIEYLLSDRELTAAEMKEKTFKAYSAPFNINPDNEYIIYVKLTDTSDNIAYINTSGIVLDATVPVISGIEDGKTYCAAQTVTVDDKYIDTVTVNGKTVTLDSNHQFALNPADGVQIIVVTDKAGNKTTFSVTVNNGHTYEWKNENGQYWRKCKYCGDETDKKSVPEIVINGSDKVCRTQDYAFSFTLPEGAENAEYGYEFIGLADGPLTPTVENGLYKGIIKAIIYPAGGTSFKLIVTAQTADGFTLTAEKIVTILNDHTGGTATCTDKAVCEVCGESYGELNANNHSNLKHIDAKSATKTAEGNIEYWYCEGCGKYYKDAEATKEITKADTVTAKLPEEEPIPPATGDASSFALLTALLIIGAGAVTAVVSKKRKHSK